MYNLCYKIFQFKLGNLGSCKSKFYQLTSKFPEIKQTNKLRSSIFWRKNV